MCNEVWEKKENAETRERKNYRQRHATQALSSGIQCGCAHGHPTAWAWPLAHAPHHMDMGMRHGQLGPTPCRDTTGLALELTLGVSRAHTLTLMQ